MKKYILRFLKFIGIISFFKKNKQIDIVYKSILDVNSEVSIFDCGANQGQSIERFSKYFAKPKIYAFEPDLSSFEFLSNKYKSHASCILINEALGEEIKKVNFNSMIKSGNSSIYEFNQKSNSYRKKIASFQNTSNLIVDKYPVQMNTIDNYVDQNEIQKINILKIDTQGNGPEVIEGAKKTLSNKLIDFIEIELILSPLYKKHNNILDIEKFLIPYSYKLIGINKFAHNILLNSPFSLDLVYCNEIIFDKLNFK